MLLLWRLSRSSYYVQTDDIVLFVPSAKILLRIIDDHHIFVLMSFNSALLHNVFTALKYSHVKYNVSWMCLKCHRSSNPHILAKLTFKYNICITGTYIVFWTWDNVCDCWLRNSDVNGEMTIYYIKLQCPFVCLSVCTPPFFSTRPSDRNQIWHTFG